MKYLGIFLIFLLLSVLSNTSEGKDLADINDLINVIENKSADWRIQIGAIKEIAKSADPRGLEILIRLINDPFLNHDCPALKFHAAEALSRYKEDSRVVETLINLAKDKDNPLSVREAAINSLGEIGDKRALNTLIDTLSEGSFALRMSSVKALGKIGDPSVIYPLEDLLDKQKDLKEEIYFVINLLKTNGDKK